MTFERSRAEGKALAFTLAALLVFLVAAVLVVYLVYDVAVGRWIWLPLDLIFLALSVSLGWLLSRLARRWHAVARR